MATIKQLERQKAMLVKRDVIRAKKAQLRGDIFRLRYAAPLAVVKKGVGYLDKYAKNYSKNSRGQAKKGGYKIQIGKGSVF